MWATLLLLRRRKCNVLISHVCASDWIEMQLMFGVVLFEEKRLIGQFCYLIRISRSTVILLLSQ